MTAQPRRDTVGFVGLGNMGTPMVARLCAAGYVVLAFDIDPQARARAVGAGAEEVSELARVAAGADVVILMLPDSRVVSAVVRDPGFVGSLSAGTIVIDMSSSEPVITRQLGAELAASGVRFVDGPVSGGVLGAERGTLTIMVGGAEEDVARAGPVLSAMGRVLPAGSLGAGHAVKALNNLLSATHLWITGEAMVAGQKFGLDPDAMLAIFNASSGRSGSTEAKWPNFILTGGYDSGFGLRLMLKDMNIAVGLAEQTGAPSSLGAAAVELWSRAAAALPPSADHTEIARWIATSAGLAAPIAPATREGGEESPSSRREDDVIAGSGAQRS
jgi:3-hydroxyisobutyrate dehydrogenase